MWSSFDKINVDFSESVLLLCCRTWRRRPRPARKANRSPHLRTLRRAKCLESCLSFTLLLSLPLYLPPLTLDNLGLMDTPALLPLLLLPPPPLLYPNYTKGRMDVSLPPHLLPSPTWRPFPPPICHLCPNTPLPQRENGYYLYSLVPLRASLQFSTFH